MKRTPKSPAVQAAAPPTPKGGFRQTDQVAIPEEALTGRERRLLEAVRAAAGPVTVRVLARRVFPGMRSKAGRYETVRADGLRVRNATAAAYRCVLNSLRRLVAGGFVIKVARGTYEARRATRTPAT